MHFVLSHLLGVTKTPSPLSLNLSASAEEKDILDAHADVLGGTVATSSHDVSANFLSVVVPVRRLLRSHMPLQNGNYQTWMRRRVKILMKAKKKLMQAKKKLHGHGMMITIYMYPLHTTPLHTTPLHITPLYTSLPSPPLGHPFLNLVDNMLITNVMVLQMTWISSHHIDYCISYICIKSPAARDC